MLPLHHFPTASSHTAQTPGAMASCTPSVTPLVLTAPTPVGAGPCYPLSFLCPLMLPRGHGLQDTAFRGTPHPHVHLVCQIAPCWEGQGCACRACVDSGCWGVFLGPVSLPESAIQLCTAPVAETGTTMTHCQEIARNAELPEHLLCPAGHPLAVAHGGITPKA